MSKHVALPHEHVHSRPNQRHTAKLSICKNPGLPSGWLTSKEREGYSDPTRQNFTPLNFQFDQISVQGSQVHV